MHPIVSAVIDAVEDAETKGIGVDPNDKRAYNESEFVKLLELLRAELDLAMALSGCPTLDDIDASLVYHPVYNAFRT